MRGAASEMEVYRYNADNDTKRDQNHREQEISSAHWDDSAGRRDDID